MSTPKLKFQRARNAEAKDARRESMLRAAERLFELQPFEEITIASIAREASTAKGTLYLYFDSKEAVFLALLLEALQEWARALTADLEKTRSRSAEGIAELVAKTLTERAQLMALLPLLHVVLERHVSEHAVDAFKRSLAELMISLGDALEQRLPSLGKQGGAEFLLRGHALAVGLAQMSQLNSTMEKVLSQPDLRWMRVDLRRELESGLAAWLRGWKAS